jgi:DUF971 family protein
MPDQRPLSIKLHKRSKTLELEYAEGSSFELSAEYLRVHSPSAEVRGHSPDEEKLQVGKREVGILELLPVGNYALKIVFDDGHDSGLYPWDYLHDLGKNQQPFWQFYLERLEAAGASRDALDQQAAEPVQHHHCKKCP